MSGELDLLNNMVGDALAGLRLTLTALRSLQVEIERQNAMPAPSASSVSTWTVMHPQAVADAKAALDALKSHLRKPRSDKGKPRKPHTPVIRGTMALSKKARAELAKRRRKARAKA